MPLFFAANRARLGHFVAYATRAAIGLVGVLISAESARAQIEIPGASVIENSAVPGGRVEGSIVVRSLSAREQDIRVYQTDYRFLADGSSEFGRPGTLVRSNARWITLTPARFTLAPGATVRVGYVIVVPGAIAPAAGGFWSAVMVEPVTPGSAESARPLPAARVRVGVDAVVRHAVQIATNVDAANARTAMQLGNSEISTDPTGRRHLALDASNTGETSVRPVLRIEVLDDAGNRVARAEQQRGLLYPGTSVRQRFDLGMIPKGTYKAVVVADTGGDDLFAAKFTLQF